MFTEQMHFGLTDSIMAESIQTVPDIESRPLTSVEQQLDADNAWAFKHYDELIRPTQASTWLSGGSR